MATAVAPGAALPAQQAAAASRQHDPIKSVEGMFNGVLIRLADALRNPKLAEATKIIVNECTKKYQDALDDCEIQILDAKWYLEASLAENKAAREAEAKINTANAESAPVKRKLEGSINERQPGPASPTKRARSNEPASPKATAAVENLSAAGDVMEGIAQDQAQSKESAKPTATKEEPTTQNNPEPEPSEKQEPQTNPDDFMQTSAQATPDFESMFTDPNDNDEGNANNDDMNIDFNFDEFIGTDSNTSNAPAAASAANPTTTQQPSQSESQQTAQTQSLPQTQTQPASEPQGPQNTSQTSLNSLLPGLEQFANQRDDTNPLNASFNMTSNTGNDSQNDPANNIFTADFEPNIFDSMFNDENFNASAEFGNVEDVDKIQSPRDGDINFDDFFS